MADEFLDPSTQASAQPALDKLRAVTDRLDAAATRAEASVRASVGRTGTSAGPRAAPETAADTGEVAVANDRLNRVLERRIALEGELRQATRTGAPEVASIEQQAQMLSRTGGRVGGDPAAMANQLQAQERARVAEQQAQVDAEQARARQMAAANAAQAQQATTAARVQAREIQSDFNQGPGGALGAPVIGGGGPSQRAALGENTAAARTAAASATDRLSDAERRLFAQAQAGAAAESQIGAGLQKNVLLSSQATNEYKRHGALTTEFISAAAKGQVTLQEFGTQITQTIGKFAGWTVAAGAVYGVIGAFSELVRGAIDASNTVGQLERTIEGLNHVDAANAVVQLAHDTNVSMQEAGNTVFQFSRTFHTLEGATTAARLALMAYQLDQVDVADTVKAATAINQQFGISAQGLSGVFDELAAGQREFNARMTEQIPLLQRSAGAVKNAGGNLQDFIEISTVALRTTQLSGSQLGTFFARSAANFLNPATSKGQAGRAVLASLGIDPNQDYTDLIMAALRRSATLSNAQRQQLALAVGGPQLGARTGAMWGGGGAALLPEVHRDLQPANVRGTFMEEFTKYLHTSRQELAAIVNNFQQLGAALGQSGLLAPLGMLVRILNETLTISTDLLKAWSSMPDAVKLIVGGGAGLLGVRAVTQRVGLTSNVPFFGRSQADFERNALTKGLQDEQGFYQGQYRSTARSAAMAGLSTSAAEAARNEQVAAYERGAVSEQAVLGAQRRYQSAVDRQLGLEQERDLLARETVAIEEQLAAVQADIKAGMTAQVAAARANLPYRLTTLGTGGPMGGVVPVAAPGAPVEEPVVEPVRSGPLTRTPGGVILPVGIAPQELEQQAEQEGQQAATGLARARVAATSAVESIGKGVSSLAMGIIGNPWMLALIGVPLLIEAAQAGSKKMDEATNALGTLPTGQPVTARNSLAYARMEQYVAGTSANVGGMSGFMVGLNRVVDDAWVKTQSNLEKAINEVQASGAPFLQRRTVDINQATDPLQKQVNVLNRAIKDNSGMLAGIERSWSDLTSDPIGAVLGGTNTNRDTTDPLKAQRANVEALMAQRSAAFYGGKPAVMMPFDTIQAQSQAAFDNFRRGVIDLNELQGEWGKSLKEATAQLNPTLSQGQRDQVVALIAQLRSQMHTRVHDLIADFQALDSAHIEQEITEALNMIKVTGSSSPLGRQSRTRVTASIGVLASRAAFDPSGTIDKTGTTNLDRYVAAQNQYTSAMSAEIQAELQSRLRVAQTRRQRAAAYRWAANATKSEMGGLEAEIAAQAKYVADLSVTVAAERAQAAMMPTVGKGVAQAVQGAIDLINAFNGAMGQILGPMGVFATLSPTPPAKLKGDEGSLKAHKAALDFLHQAEREFEKSIKQQIDGYKGLADKSGDSGADASQIQSLRDQINVAQAQGDPVRVAQIEIANAHRDMALAEKIKDRKKRLQAMLQAQLSLLTAENDLANATQDVSQSYFDVASAAAWDPITKATIDIQKAASAMAHAHGTAAYNAAQAQLIGAQHQQAQAIEDRIQSQYDVLESQTTDPVRIAALELRKANQKLDWERQHGGTGTQAYNEAMSSRNQAQQKLVDTKLQGREDDIEFELTMGKISTQTAIDQYQALLKIHGVTKQMRRQVLERIKALQNEGQSEFAALNLGTLRLPTPYEIRRALLANQQGVNVTQHYSTSINVNDERGAAAVGVQMERYHGGVYKAVQRATGSR